MPNFILEINLGNAGMRSQVMTGLHDDTWVRDFVPEVA